MTADAAAFVRLALGQAGKRYVLGVPVDPADPDPPAFDCSGLVVWAAARAGVTPAPAHATWVQWQACRRSGLAVAVDAAVATPGALLFNHRDADGRPVDPVGPTPSAHVAISLGDGRTIEAMGTAWGTCVGRAAGRAWTSAGMLPGLDYGAGAAVPAPAALAVPAAVAPAAGSADAPPRLGLGLPNPPDAVRRLQTSLAAASPALPALTVDGWFGPVTDVVLRAFQLACRHDDPSFVVDGVCGPVTWGRLGQAGRSATLRCPATGDDVVALQQALVGAGVTLPAVVVDGWFGPLTDVVVRAFQLAAHLGDPAVVVDGVCGPQTWSLLGR